MTPSAIVSKLWGQRGGCWFLRCINDQGAVLASALKIAILEASDNLPDPDVIAQEIVEDLEAALEQFREIVVDLDDSKVEKTTH